MCVFCVLARLLPYTHEHSWPATKRSEFATPCTARGEARPGFRTSWAQCVSESVLSTLQTVVLADRCMAKMTKKVRGGHAALHVHVSCNASFGHGTALRSSLPAKHVERHGAHSLVSQLQLRIIREKHQPGQVNCSSCMSGKGGDGDGGDGGDGGGDGGSDGGEIGGAAVRGLAASETAAVSRSEVSCGIGIEFTMYA